MTLRPDEQHATPPENIDEWTPANNARAIVFTENKLWIDENGSRNPLPISVFPTYISLGCTHITREAWAHMIDEVRKADSGK